MSCEKYLAAYQPEWKLIHDNPPPLGTKLLFRGLHTGAVISVYHPEYEFVAWMELPTFSPETRSRLDQLIKDGANVTAPNTVQGNLVRHLDL